MDGQLNARQIIDCIVYLASLASEPRSVDVILDKLRAITAKSSQPSAHDVEVLKSVQAELEDYLVHKERLRAFTHETLRANVERHFAAGDPAHSAHVSALKRIILTIIGAAVVTAIPVVTGFMKGQVILAFFIFTLFVGLALIFQSIKKNLVAQLHGAVNYLMAATIGTGLFALNFPVIAENHYLNNLPLLQHGGFLEGAIPVYAFYYLAFYLYAKQLNVAIPWILKPVGAGLSAIGVAALCFIVPHPVKVPDELYFDLAMTGFGVSVYFSAVAAVLGFKTVPKTTALYSKTTLFLAISMVLQTLGNGFFVVYVTYRSGDFPVNQPKGQVLTAFLIMAALTFQYVAAYKSRTSLAE